MPAGRPEVGRQKVHPELVELADWFRRALIEAGFDSVNALIQRHPFEKNRIYGLFRGTRFLALESTQAVAVALGRRGDEVEPLWWRAKSAMERAAAADRASAGRVASWSRLPWPHVALQDILEAQSQAADTLPYHLLGVEPPPLSTVYVRQLARLEQLAAKRDRQEVHGAPTDDVGRVTDDTAIPITEALDRHEHLLILGEPGAGKSTLTQFLALNLSRLWLRTSTAGETPLREPVVPLRIAARGLTGGETWSVAVARATRLALGARLVAEPTPSLFERRAQGVRWLVLVDGLDEIVDPVARSSVIEALAARCRPDGDYRIIITSRQLPEGEVAPLRARRVTTYQLEPFGSSELGAFARCWFAAQHTTDSDSDADRFLRQIEDGELRELARNPLLATIAAVAYTLEPNRPLPTDRLGLYERIFEHLVTHDSSGRRTVSELRRLYADEPDRVRFISWLHEQRVPLLRHLGLTSIEGERPLRDAARDWVHAHAAEPQPSWNQDVEIILAGTGLLVFEPDGARFLHYSFAEFLAAQEHASRLSADFAELPTWVSRAMRPADREYVMFVFALWSRRPGHELRRIFDTLLTGHPDFILLAGRLLARVPTTTHEESRRVVDRLVDLAIGTAMVDGLERTHDTITLTALSITPLPSVLEVIGQLTQNTHAAGRLCALSELTGIPMRLRVGALEALGKIADTHDATQRLRRLMPACRNRDLVEAARVLYDLVPGDAIAIEKLTAVGDDPTAPQDARADAASELYIIGRLAEATRIARILISLRPAHPSAFGRAIRTWLGCVADAEERTRLSVELLEERLHPELCREAASELADAGLTDAAGRLADQVIADVRSSHWLLINAVKLRDMAGSLTVAELNALLPDPSNPERLACVARGFAEAAHTDAAIEVAQQVVHHPAARAWDVAAAVRAWIIAGGTGAMPAIREALDRRLRERPLEWGGQIAQELHEAGQREAAVHYARQILRTQRSEEGGLWNAPQAWLAAAGLAATPEIRAAINDGPPLNPRALAMAAEGVALGGASDLAVELALEALLGIGPDDFRFGSAVRALILAQGPAAEESLRAVMAGRTFASREWMCITEHLAASGAIAAAQRIWSELLAHPDTPSEHRALASARILISGGSTSAYTSPTS